MYAVAYCQVTRKTYLFNPWVMVSYRKYRKYVKPV